MYEERKYYVNFTYSRPEATENDIDVYLAPLVEDLHHLWSNGVTAYDAFSKTLFKLNAILLWTINDFPAYENLAGCRVKGQKACPLCGVNTHSRWLKHSRKFAYMGHRRFPPPSDSRRKQKALFDNTIEIDGAPRMLSGRNIYALLKDYPNDFGKGIEEKSKKIKHVYDKEDEYDDTNSSTEVELSRWKKRSIFFDLPYWEVSG